MATFKDQGNEEFKKENYLKAAAMYTKAIKEEPENAILYSNRSAALLKLSKVTKAMEDAEKCIALKPDWEKGYFRKAAVLEAQDKLQEALEVYQAASRLSPESAANRELGGKIRSLTKLLKLKAASAGAAAHKEETLESVLLAATTSAPSGSGDGVAALGEFCRDVAAAAMDSVTESGTAFAPSLHFLPGPDAEVHEEREAHIQAAHAFGSPELLADFVNGMREHGKRLAARAAVAVVPKAVVAFPQLWTRKGWPPACGGKQAPGVFVHLELRGTGGRHMWFVPLRADKSTLAPVALSVDEFGLLPPLLG